MKMEKNICFNQESKLSFEDLEAFKDVFKGFDISESDLKPPTPMAVGRGAESLVFCVMINKRKYKMFFITDLNSWIRNQFSNVEIVM